MKLAVLSIVGLAACTGVFSSPSSQHQESAPSAGKRVFVTSERYQGGYLGGLDGADATCQRHAERGGLTGTFKAWLSSVGNSVADRLQHAAEPYVLVDGTLIADDWADLTHGDLAHAIDHDEAGLAIAADAVWSFTKIDGVAYSWTPGGDPTSNLRTDCQAWTQLTGFGMLGAAGTTDEGWTAGGAGILCTQKARLYCFEQ